MAGARAGLEPGDLLLTWRVAPDAGVEATAGPIESPLTLRELERGTAPRAAVTLVVRRRAGSLTVELTPGGWGIEAHPQLSKARRVAHEEGSRLLAEDDPAGAARLWRQLAEELASEERQAAAVWFMAQAGRAAVAGRAPEARETFDQARALAAQAGRDDWLAAAWEIEAESLEQAREPDSARVALEKAVELRESGGESVALAGTLLDLGNMVKRHGDLDAGAALIRSALAILRRQAPGSLTLARALRDLGVAAAEGDDLDAAEGSFREALELARRMAPAGPEVAATFDNLGSIASLRGDLATAVDLHTRALTIQERLAPEAPAAAKYLSNLGIVARRRGDLATAEGYYRRALAIQERLGPESLAVARSLGNLGNLAGMRGDLVSAEDLHRQALAIFQELAPESPYLAQSFKILGDLALERGDPAAAGELLSRALDLYRRQAPGGHRAAQALHSLGLLAEKRGDPEAARQLHNEALEIRRRRRLGGYAEAESLFFIGRLAGVRGDVPVAEEYLRGALAIRSRQLPGSTEEAQTLHELGRLYRDSSRIQEAREHLRRAVEAIDAQRGRLGGTEQQRSRYAAQHTDLYQDYVELLVDLGAEEEAFHVLERYRARELLALLATRDMRADGELPRELVEERRSLARRHDLLQEELARLDAAERQRVDELLTLLRRLAGERARLAARVRAASPRLADLEDPRPLTSAEVREALDRGTALISYCVTASRTLLFVLPAAGGGDRTLRVYARPVGRAELIRRVEAFRHLLQIPAAGAPSRAALDRRAQELYRLLVAPAAEALAGARRLLVIADGPLHLVPFAALLSESTPPRYLVQDLPVHTVVSATVHAELLRRRRADGKPPGTLVAFGDPVYRSATTGATPARYRSLGPLPASRTEVEAIARLYRPAARAYLGAEATERRAKTVDREVRYLHFSTHGFADYRFPLDSYLALSVPADGGGDNGLLQAWEIFEQVRLDAELVSLSACDTGLGPELGGEGVIGLHRAFHYAGARSVLASLWRVSDRSTATLMTRFYRHLRSGRPKTEALAAAQLELIAEHPFYWAAFQLSGDWR